MFHNPSAVRMVICDNRHRCILYSHARFNLSFQCFAPIVDHSGNVAKIRQSFVKSMLLNLGTLLLFSGSALFKHVHGQVS
jgi:hypothetical protein